MCCLCFRCPDTSVQSILCDIWDGTKPGGPLRFLLLLTQPGVSGMCWPCLWLSLRSSCLRRLQGKWSVAPSFYYCRAKMSPFSLIPLIKKYYLEAVVYPHLTVWVCDQTLSKVNYKCSCQCWDDSHRQPFCTRRALLLAVVPVITHQKTFQNLSIQSGQHAIFL